MSRFYLVHVEPVVLSLLPVQAHCIENCVKSDARCVQRCLCLVTPADMDLVSSGDIIQYQKCKTASLYQQLFFFSLAPTKFALAGFVVPIADTVEEEAGGDHNC